MNDRKFSLNNNQLKVIAMIAMTIDHACKELPIGYPFFLQIIGRLAFPIFAYMIAEGCYYTKNRARYFGSIFALGLACQAVYFIAVGSLYQNILLTFSLSILTIYCIENCLKRQGVVAWLTAVGLGCGLAWLYFLMPHLVKGFELDYGFFGMLVPVFIYFAPHRAAKLATAGFSLTMLAYASGGVQWWSLSALIPLALYNGRRGKANLKYLFYIFYPAHLAAIYLIGLIIRF